MATRFLIVFALTNTLAVGAFAAFMGGGAAGFALGAVLTVLALAGFVVIARVVVLTRPSRPRRDQARLLMRQVEDDLR